jgi:hypothetical protein
MVHLGCPQTHQRYLAEIKNVLTLWTRPVYIHGRPRASVREIREFLGAVQVSRFELQIGDSTLVWYDDCLVIV